MARTLLKACGFTDEELDRPLVAVVNSWTNIVPGHVHLDKVAEAVEAVIKDRDIISIDIPNRRLDLKIPKEELQERLKQWRPPEPKVKKGILSAYSKIVKPTSKGTGFLF